LSVERLKVLYLTSRLPYPLDKGDKLRAYYQIKTLSQNHDIILVAVYDEWPSKKDLEHIRDINAETHIVHIPTIDRLSSLLGAWVNHTPYQTAWFYSRKVHDEIDQIVATQKPDAIICQLARMAHYVSGYTGVKILDYMDAFGVGMERRAAISSWPMSMIYRSESRRMKKYEKDIFQKFDHATIISGQDRDCLDFEAAKHIHILPNGIDPYFFEAVSTEKQYDIAFVGNMNYLPNVEAVEVLVHQVLPLCKSKPKVVIAGTSPHSRVCNLASDHVVVTGWIDDIRIAYTSARICCAPIWSGTGQQNKILEAMALGVPCITTSTVNKAIGATDGQELLIADTVAEFAERIDRLLAAPNQQATMGVQSRSWVRDRYDWQEFGNQLAALIRSK
jgi:polysaccharide biosynthesis protein PslH